MAKKKAPSKRAQERAALQKLYASATLSGLQNLLDMGKLDLKEVRKYYTDARSKAVKRVERIEKSDVPFTDAAPEFRRTKELSDEDLLKAVAQVNKFLRRPTRLQDRREAYKDLIDDLHSKGLTFVNMNNLKQWDRFRTWVKAKGIINLPYVDGSVIADIFKTSLKEGNANSKRWNELYSEFKSMLGGQGRKRRSRNRRK